MAILISMHNTRTDMTSRLLLALCLGMCGFASAANAQSVHASVSANVIEDVVIVSQTPLNFGFISAGLNGGTATVTSNNLRLLTGNVVASGADFSRATFGVQGASNHPYSIHTPSSLTFSVSADNPDLISSLLVNNFVTYSVNTGGESSIGQLSASGTDVIYLGGTITVPANAAPGIYTGLVPLTVSY